MRAIRGDDVDSSGTSGERFPSVDFQSVRDTFFVLVEAAASNRTLPLAMPPSGVKGIFPRSNCSLQISWRWSNAIT